MKARVASLADKADVQFSGWRSKMMTERGKSPKQHYFVDITTSTCCRFLFVPLPGHSTLCLLAGGVSLRSVCLDSTQEHYRIRCLPSLSLHSS